MSVLPTVYMPDRSLVLPKGNPIHRLGLLAVVESIVLYKSGAATVRYYETDGPGLPQAFDYDSLADALRAHRATVGQLVTHWGETVMLWLDHPGEVAWNSPWAKGLEVYSENDPACDLLAEASKRLRGVKAHEAQDRIAEVSMRGLGPDESRALSALLRAAFAQNFDAAEKAWGALVAESKKRPEKKPRRR